jgi:hypothetical protein
VLTQKGISSSSLPNLHIISPELKRDILAGKHVNLAKLLIPNFKESAPREMQLGESLITLKPLGDTKLDKPLSINEFIVAFNIYIDIVTSVYPARRPELDAYMADIIKISARYQGFRFYDYHLAFSQKAAQYLQEKAIKVDWGSRDQGLFMEIFSGLTPNSCTNCNSLNHTTRFCPQSSQPSTFKNNFNATNNTTTNNHANYRQPANPSSNSLTDIQGRPVVKLPDGRSVCNNFNTSKGCSSRNCPRVHVCAHCKRAHPQIKCTANQFPKN